MKKINFHSLKNKIRINNIVIGLAGFSIVALIGFYKLSSYFESRQIENLKTISALKLDKMEAYFDGIKSRVRIIQSLPNVRNSITKEYFETSTGNILKNANHSNLVATLDKEIPALQKINNFHDIMLVDSKLTILYSSNLVQRDLEFGQNLKAKSEQFNLFSDSLDSLSSRSFGDSQVYFSEPFQYQNEDKDLTILVASPIYDFSNKLSGFVIIELRLDTLHPLLEDYMGLGESGGGVITFRNQDQVTLLYSSRNNKNTQSIETYAVTSITDPALLSLIKGEKGADSFLEDNGKKLLRAWEPITVKGLNHLGFISFIDKAEVLDPFYKTFKSILWIAGLCSLLIFVWSEYSAKQIVGPIDQLTKIAQDFSRGQFKTNIPQFHSHDEIQILGETFSSLAPTLISKDELEIEVKMRIKKEEELLKAHEEISKNQRMAALGMLGAGIAHELNNPLMGIINQIQYVIAKLPKDQRPHEILSEALILARRSISIVQDLLSYSRKNEDAIALKRFGQYTKPQEAIQSALMTKKTVLQNANVEVLTEICDNPNLIGLATSPFQRIIENMISNACDAMEHSPIKKITIKLNAVEKNFELLIQDTGSGMNEDTKARLFEPFFTTKEVGRGTGLGLTLCKNLIDGAGGKIYIESEVNHGTLIKIYFPIIAADGIYNQKVS